MSDYCIGHDPAISTEMRNSWRRKSTGIPRPKHADYRFMNAQEIIAYASDKIATLEKKYGDSLEVMPFISDFLRVLIQANRILKDKDELRLKKDKDSGPRSIRIVRDEPDAVRAANAGK